MASVVFNPFKQRFINGEVPSADTWNFIPVNRKFKKEFAESLRLFDHIIVTDIYAAREQNIYGVSSLDIINELLEIKKDVIYLKDYEEIKDYLSTKIKQKRQTINKQFVSFYIDLF